MPFCRSCLIFLTVILLSILNFSVQNVSADWATDYTKPTCSIATSPSSPQTTGNKVIITATASTPSKITALKIGNNTVWSGSPTSPVSYDWNTGGSIYPTGNYTIIATVVNTLTGNANSCTLGYTLNDPSPTPTPAQGYSTPNASTSTSPAYCYMNWWQNTCSTTIYWGVSWAISNFYISVYDYWNGWRWTVCDTRWSGFWKCNRPNGRQSQSIGFNNPLYTSGTQYTLTGQVGYSTQYTDISRTYTSGFRYQTPSPNIQYANGTSCLFSDSTGDAIARIYFPTPSGSNPVRPITWVDISEDPNFSTYYHKEVNTSQTPYATYTDAPVGFNGSQGVSGPLTISPNKVYYVRLYGSESGSNWSTAWFNPSGGGWGWWSGVAVLSRPTCAVPTPTPTPVAIPTPTPTPLPPSAPSNPTGSCVSPGTRAELRWGASQGSGITYYGTIRNGGAPSSFITFGTSYTVTPTTSGNLYGLALINPPHNTSWSVRACNGTGCSAEPAGGTFYCIPPSSTLNTPDPNNPNSPQGGLSACTGSTYTGNLTWGGNPYYSDPDGSGPQTYQWGSWVDISTDPLFATYYKKWVPCSNPQNRSTCTNQTSMPAGFTNFDNNNTLSTLDSQTTYYFRVYNGNTPNPGYVQFSKTCPPSTPNPPTAPPATCTNGGTTANLYWDPVSGITYYIARVGSLSSDTRSNPDPAIPNTQVLGLTPNSSYSWGVKACNAGGCSAESAGSPSLECKPNPAYLKTTGGDVHSNR